MRPEIDSAGRAAVGATALGVALFSLMDGAMKTLALEVGVFSALLWRAAFLIPFGAILYLRSKPQKPSAEAMKLHTLRGLLSLVMALLFFWGLTQIPIAQATGLSFIAPIIALWLSTLLLDERPHRNAYLGAALALSGIIIMLNEELRNAQPSSVLGALAVLVSAGLYGYNLILQRQQALVAAPLEISFIQTSITAVFLLLGSLYFKVEPLDPELIVYAAIAAALALGALICFSWAYRRAPASRLVNMEYSAFVWAALIGWIFFKEPLSTETVMGTILIVAGCFIAART